MKARFGGCGRRRATALPAMHAKEAEAHAGATAAAEENRKEVRPTGI